ncbi:MAG: DUF882 domain-containing protein [Gammaproteobacteria bacterium]
MFLDHRCTPLTRRRFLRLAGAAGALFAFGARAATGPRELAFHHLHTGENLRAEYWRDGRYEPDALRAIDRVLRDHRTGTVAPIATDLLDFLHRLNATLDTRAPMQIICGYRSRATNEMLHRNTTGVATNSLHLDGRAIDLRIPGVPLARLRDAALAQRFGGVGYYPGSDFVHVDNGRPRRW